VRKDQLAQQDQQVRRGLLVRKVQLVHKDFKVLQAQQALKARKEAKE